MGMEVNVLNELPGGGGILTVSTHPNATVDSLIGAACQDKKLTHQPSIGLYTKDNRLLSARGSLRAQNIRPGDTLYLRFKQSEDDILYYTNWKILSVLCLITGMCGLGFAFVVFFFTGGQVPFVYGIVVEVGTSHTEATLYHWEGAKLGGTGRVDQVRRVESQQVGLAQTAAPGATSRDISGLLDSLKEYVPESQRPTTPIYLLATEGMRLNKRPVVPKTEEPMKVLSMTTTSRPTRIRGRLRGRKTQRWVEPLEQAPTWTGSSEEKLPPVKDEIFGYRRIRRKRRTKRKVEDAESGDSLINPKDTDTALLAVECALRSSGFSFRSAGILSGRDEGIYGWLSTNYLLGRLPPPNGARKLFAGSLDLSEASSHIAFAVSDKEAVMNADVTRLRLFGEDFFVYSRSSLCFGVGQAYLRYLARIIHDNKYVTGRALESSCHHRGQLIDVRIEHIFSTHCTQTPKMDTSILFKLNESVTFNGTSDPEGCQALTEDLVDESLCDEQGYVQCFKPLERRIPSIDYTAFAEFYKAAKIINFTRGSLAEFSSATEQFCSSGKQQLRRKGFSEDDHEPTACFRLNYILRLLREKYSFDEETMQSLTFAQSEQGYRLGWGLGFMINATNSLPAAPPVPPMITNELFALMVIMFAIFVAFGSVFGCLSKRRQLVMRNGLKSEIP